MQKKKLVVLSGAGISAESGLSTFRGSDGLWNGYSVYEVASPQGWAKDSQLVLNFYNMRRRSLNEVEPNKGHMSLVDLETYFDVTIITQNVDDLHERAGSKNIVHLHGELTKAESTFNKKLVYDIGYKDILPGDTCEKGSQLRPSIVWFGEDVPMIEQAAVICLDAEIFIIVGTSMQVYPAAGLIDYLPRNCKKYIVDPDTIPSHLQHSFKHIKENGTVGLPLLVEELKQLI
ncbi:MAG: NAD-dependent deacylase [Bacteroidetes bacterium]|nr:NAD-dependent deacylase [Bacteroidota bacterium]